MSNVVEKGNKEESRGLSRIDMESMRRNSSDAKENLMAEGGESFFSYLSELGLENDQNMLVLPNNHHYYYDDSELKSVTTLVNIRKLNRIRNLNSFLGTLCSVMSHKSNFVGCFTDNRGRKDVKLSSKLYNNFINFLDARTDNTIGRQDVSKMFEAQGFKIMNMTEINGMTYFATQYCG